MTIPPTPVETLALAARGVVAIRLNTIGLLFRGPDLDPFAGSHDDRSGMDHLELALKSRRGTSRPDITTVEWVVPPEEATEKRQEETRDAIAGWCERQSVVARGELSAMAEERRRAWLVGGMFFVACFAVAAALETSQVLSGLGGTLISETIVIAGWVGLWHPLDLTLYASWSLRSRLKLLSRIGGLDVKLVPDARNETPSPSR
jgi:hypothetical protein